MVSGKLGVDAEISIPWRHWTPEIETPAEKIYSLIGTLAWLPTVTDRQTTLLGL